MEKRTLGHSNIEVSAIGLGTMGMDHAYGPQADRTEMVTLLRKAVELGCNFFDTAVIYGEENEMLLGEAFEPIRDQVVIATKFGITGQEIVDGEPQNVLDSRPDSIREQVEGSLKRLRTDVIDLYYQHRVDPNVSPETVAQTMKELIEEGKIRAWGLSNAPIDYIRRAHAVCPLSAIENQYSMVWRKPEEEIFDLCEELGLAFVAYSPLGNGFLSGKYSKNTQFAEGDFRNFMGRFQPETLETNQEVLDVIADIAKRKNVTSAQIVFAWELAQKPFIIPIPGTTKLHRLEENLGGAAVQLSNKELKEINKALAKIDIDETYF
ncbi:aldo/keto reductase [Tetragenococcus halophilus]|uniref:Aldo/keto reductase n=1 Tax=Tetragenococcus halophilus TaxID=51669 RepID=A0A3G5FHV8_TETHA|nr:aldo/keto reductase [Tetragenococcus halophilus]MDN6385554.1 aldo/keto reductase [Alkalibacterium sp.]MDN6497346.1 aldo/keto reductase [Tetragenococcus koreensis]AYW49914.1 aldo/keto reductase [Tetragenococcus halophilus]MDN6112740.1 aldo/keto reductase [Tetragenococcus halophilus]MDN6129418.1 aldo/keto reductase [Tetragenococcus halophilus]